MYYILNVKPWNKELYIRQIHCITLNVRISESASIFSTWLCY